MTRPGPAKTPTKLRVLRGETRPSQINTREAVPADATPTMPDDMGEPSRAVWRGVIDQFGHTGVISGADSELLRLYCDAVVRYRDVQRLYAASQPLLQSHDHGGQLVKNPLHQMVRDNAAMVQRLGAELGLSPSARAGIPAAPKVATSRLAELLAMPPRKRTG